ncbi:MAG TPA: TetR/AcrR family transcriptional regulator [Solirubrobacteraceae bacterium]|nr:TetR/AcrR family transcriptional regulator [Solirubrobacteraceae bacterium]
MASAELPPVPRLPSRRSAVPRRGPRERALSREAIATAALAVIDAEGLDAMTMRRVAEELGTGAASLYAHVAGKEELVELVIDRVIGEVEIPEIDDAESPPASWQEEIKAGLRAIRAEFGRHRDLARASFARIPMGENALRGSEWMIATMRRGGLPDQVIAYAIDLLSLYVMAISYEDGLYAGEQTSPADIEAFVADMRRYMAALPAERFPNVVALAGPLTAGTGDERFEFGLEVLVRGVAAMAESPG